MAFPLPPWVNGPPKQWLFRYGQLALRSGRPVPTLPRLLTWRRLVPDDDLAPGVMVIQKDAELSRVHLWIGAVLHGQPTDTVAAEVELRRADEDSPRTRRVDLQWFSMESERVVTRWDEGTRFFHTHVTFDDLPTNAWFDVRVQVPDPQVPQPALEARCRARTLPTELIVGAPPLNIFTASCYDVDTDKKDRLDCAYKTLFTAVPGPDMTWITGDATYADAPFWLYGSLARHAPRTFALLEYWGAWGMHTGSDDDLTHRRPGLRSLLTSGPNWFLADDHEFWNNWPHATVTARHSYGNIWKGLKGAAARKWGAQWRPLGPDDKVPVPDEPGPAPTDPRVQSYLPVHPDEWDRWSRGAFDLLGSFETRSAHDRATGHITRGELDEKDRHRPPADGPRGVVHRPLNEVLQTIDIGTVQVALLDTRTRRTRKIHHPVYSSFVDEQYLDGTLELARRAEIFVLVMPEPALVRPAWCDDPTSREKLISTDLGIHDYWHQYERFWTGLVEARDGRPMITVGGDIHRSYVAYAPTLSLVSLVASPMSPVFGQAMMTAVTDVWERLKSRPGGALLQDPFEPGQVLVEVDDLLSGPLGLAARKPGGQAVSVSHLPRPDADDGGFAILQLSRTEEHRYRLVSQLHPRNQLADGDVGGVQTVSFDLRTDVRGPESVVRTDQVRQQIDLSAQIVPAQP